PFDPEIFASLLGNQRQRDRGDEQQGKQEQGVVEHGAEPAPERRRNQGPAGRGRGAIVIHGSELAHTPLTNAHLAHCVSSLACGRRTALYHFVYAEEKADAYEPEDSSEVPVGT